MLRLQSRYIYNATIVGTSLVYTMVYASIPLVRRQHKNYSYFDETLPIIRSFTFSNCFHQLVTATIHYIIIAVIHHDPPARSSSSSWFRPGLFILRGPKKEGICPSKKRNLVRVQQLYGSLPLIPYRASHHWSTFGQEGHNARVFEKPHD